jgi:hypothetical protein
MNITNVRFVTTIWTHKGMRHEDFMNSIKRDAEGRFKVKEMKAQLNRQSECIVSFSQFDIQTLQMMPLKVLKLENIEISQLDLKVIRSMRTIESLIFLNAMFRMFLEMFLPN